MILTGKQIMAQRLIRNLLNPTLQQQPCGVDLTLRQVSVWTTAGSVDLNNVHRVAARTRVLPFELCDVGLEKGVPGGGRELEKEKESLEKGVKELINGFADEKITLKPGAYLIDFHERIRVPLGYMARIHARSSLWRGGVSVQAGVVDAGYEGCLGALLDVRNERGVVLYKNARVAQVCFEEMGGVVGEGEGYGGIYQGLGGVGGEGVSV